MAAPKTKVRLADRALEFASAPKVAKCYVDTLNGELREAIVETAEAYVKGEPVEIPRLVEFFRQEGASDLTPDKFSTVVNRAKARLQQGVK